jgi:cullin-associated NEDD8-dissociated protein 1
LQERVKSPSAYARATVVTALKFTILDHPLPIDALLLPRIGDFLDLLSDKELNVRRVTLLTFNYGAHNKPSLIREVLPRYMPIVYGEAKVKPELIREVDLGPFKHKVDDGLEIRKAAFECMYTLLDSSLDRLDIAAFIASIGEGLKDHYDIKMLCHLMLIRLATYAPAALAEGLVGLVEPLRANVLSKLTDGAVKQQIERNDELIRSTLRAIAAISRIPNVESVQQFDDFVKKTITAPNQPLAERYAAIVTEESVAHSSDLMDTTS